MIKSKSWGVRSENQKLLSTVTGKPSLLAFRRARFTASSTQSQAVTCQVGRSLASASAIAPVPVPKSSTLALAGRGKASADSTRHSVSGLGISVELLTNNESDQNS